ncbi:hypothetical protein CTT30_22975 (plasmid) [Vibrio coralliilyticus]|nr:hypothetical protein CTT30_22975 [Vibrio coralliilyticus]
MKTKSFKTQELDGHTFHLNYKDGEWVLTVTPEFRSNGTESFDGWCPRFYKKPCRGKAALTRFLGNEWLWEEIN